MGRRVFSREFKLEAVKLVAERGLARGKRRRIWMLGKASCAVG